MCVSGQQTGEKGDRFLSAAAAGAHVDVVLFRPPAGRRDAVRAVRVLAAAVAHPVALSGWGAGRCPRSQRLLGCLGC